MPSRKTVLPMAGLALCLYGAPFASADPRRRFGRGTHTPILAAFSREFTTFRKAIGRCGARSLTEAFSAFRRQRKTTPKGELGGAKSRRSG